MTSHSGAGADPLAALALAAPTADALFDPRSTFDRAGLDRFVDRIAGALGELGAEPGSRVALLMGNRAEMLATGLAARRAGLTVVPLSPRLSPPEVQRCLDVARPTVVAIDESTCQLVSDARSILSIDHVPHDAPMGRPPPAASPDRLGGGPSMMFTSGTTGAPKAAVRARGDAALSAAIAEGLGLANGARFSPAGPLYHSGPWTCSMMALARGGAVGVLPRFEARAWLAFAIERALDSAFVTPTHLRALLDVVEAEDARPPLRNVIVSGEPFPAPLKERAVRALGPCFVECYGCTELGPLTFMAPERLLERPASCGRPFPGVEVAAFTDGRALPPGQIGTLMARTPLAFEGYLTPTGLTLGGEQRSAWATVGDLGFVDGDGFVHVVGRADDVIISGGINVHPADVEAVLLQHPDVRCGVAFALPDPERGEAVCAAVIAERPIELDELRGWMSARLSKDKLPRRVFCVDALPTTASGKISRRALTAHFGRRVELSGSGAAAT